MTALSEERREQKFAYIYFWHRHGRKDQLCRVNARGKMNSCEFTDGFKMITSRNAIRRAPPALEV